MCGIHFPLRDPLPNSNRSFLNAATVLRGLGIDLKGMVLIMMAPPAMNQRDSTIIDLQSCNMLKRALIGVSPTFECRGEREHVMGFLFFAQG